MKKEELRECQFIDEALKFYTYEDFYRDKKTIKAMYRTLDNKIFYKWFVYANINISLVQKDAIWEYLNGDDLKNLRAHLRRNNGRR